MEHYRYYVDHIWTRIFDRQAFSGPGDRGFRGKPLWFARLRLRNLEVGQADERLTPYLIMLRRTISKALFLHNSAICFIMGPISIHNSLI